MKIDKPGIYKNFDEAAYFADPCPGPSLTQSVAKVLIEQSLLHAREEHPRLASPDDDDDEAEKYVKAQAIGNAAHAILIGRGKTLAIGQFDSWRGKDAQAFKDAALEDSQTPILEKHFNAAHRMALATRLQLTAAAAEDRVLDDAFVNGNGEVVIAAEIDGIWLRSLVDWMVNPRLLFDYKSTAASVAPHVIPNKMADDGWPIQAAMQERILDVLDPDGAGRRRFFFVAQENYKPFAITVHELPEGTMAMGRKMVAKAEAMWREAITMGRWPGYEPRIHQPEYPGWKESAWLNREIADAAHAREPKMLTSLAGG
ncbi:MAG: PD-(D/E)XK nuclease-like domain-containing protein [Rhodospirillaceae bacterium]